LAGSSAAHDLPKNGRDFGRTEWLVEDSGRAGFQEFFRSMVASMAAHEAAADLRVEPPQRLHRLQAVQTGRDASSNTTLMSPW
jgi:hypothetical protein